MSFRVTDHLSCGRFPFLYNLRKSLSKQRIKDGKGLILKFHLSEGSIVLRIVSCSGTTKQMAANLTLTEQSCNVNDLGCYGQVLCCVPCENLCEKKGGGTKEKDCPDSLKKLF